LKNVFRFYYKNLSLSINFSTISLALKRNPKYNSPLLGLDALKKKRNVKIYRASHDLPPENDTTWQCVINGVKAISTLKYILFFNLMYSFNLLSKKNNRFYELKKKENQSQNSIAISFYL